MCSSLTGHLLAAVIVMKTTLFVLENEKRSNVLKMNFCFSSTLTDQQSKESEAVTKLPQKNVCVRNLDISPPQRIQTQIFSFRYFTSVQNPNTLGFHLDEREKERKAKCG